VVYVGCFVLKFLRNICIYKNLIHICPNISITNDKTPKISIKMEASTNEFLRGTLKTIVLKLLAEQGRMYGYEITQSVKERTGGAITLTFGALYPVLHKLEQEGLLITDSVEVDGRLRKYYSLTPTGSAAAVQKVSDFERFVVAMNTLLTPQLSLG
jgi:PadR family transcriptional regulator, regulatory protein PadR